VRFGILKTALVGAALAIGVYNPAQAVTTVLDFNGNICGVGGNSVCGNGNDIGQSYGDSAIVDVGYRVIDVNTNQTFYPALNYWSSGFGDLMNVVYAGGNATGFKAEIKFAPAAGYEVALLSFDAGCFANATGCRALPYSIASVGGGVFSSGTVSTLSPLHGILAVNSVYYASGIVLQWGPDANNGGLDNIRFDVRRIAGPGAVPEPATWAMMLFGFGLVGSTMRRRSATSASAMT
jgi:PEP-CTERM motif